MWLGGNGWALFWSCPADTCLGSTSASRFLARHWSSHVSTSTQPHFNKTGHLALFPFRQPHLYRLYGIWHIYWRHTFILALLAQGTCGSNNNPARPSLLRHLTASQEQSLALTPGPVCVWPKLRRIGMAGWSQRTIYGSPVLEIMSIKSSVTSKETNDRNVAKGWKVTSVRFLISWVIPKRVKALYPTLDWLVELVRVDVETT